MADSVLYYPSIEFASSQWLKTALLLWDCVYRIVPAGYKPADDSDVIAAVDSDLVRSVTLERADLVSVSAEFKAFLDSLPFLPAGLDIEYTDRVHRDKIDAQLYPVLERLARRVDPEGFLELPSEISRGYMMYLANAVAERRQLATATDTASAWTISSYFRDSANYDEFVYNTSAEAFYCALIFRGLVPSGVERVSMTEIVDFVQRRRDERQNLRDRLHEFAVEVSTCESPSHITDLCNSFVRELEKAKSEYRKSMGFLNQEDLHSLLTLGVPVSATVLSALAPGGDPYGFAKISTSLLVGAVAAYASYKKVQERQRRRSDVAYLVDIDTLLTKQHPVPAYTRFFDEFMND